MKRQWYRCRKCGRVAYKDYIPFSTANPILDLGCGHSPFNEVAEAITAKEARAWLRTDTVVDGIGQVCRCTKCGDEVPIPLGDIEWFSAVSKAFIRAHRRCDGVGGKTKMTVPVPFARRKYPKRSTKSQENGDGRGSTRRARSSGSKTRIRGARTK